jgi:hypothetical protein
MLWEMVRGFQPFFLATRTERKTSANYDTSILMGLAAKRQGLCPCPLASQQLADSGYDDCSSVPNTLMLSR